jgi:hypothetical protein
VVVVPGEPEVEAGRVPRALVGPADVAAAPVKPEAEAGGVPPALSALEEQAAEQVDAPEVEAVREPGEHFA